MHIRFEERKNRVHQLGNVDSNYRPRQSHWTETCACFFVCVRGRRIKRNVRTFADHDDSFSSTLRHLEGDLCVCFFLHGCIEEGSFSDIFLLMPSLLPIQLLSTFFGVLPSMYRHVDLLRHSLSPPQYLRHFHLPTRRFESQYPWCQQFATLLPS